MFEKVVLIKNSSSKDMFSRTKVGVLLRISFVCRRLAWMFAVVLMFLLFSAHEAFAQQVPIEDLYIQLAICKLFYLIEGSFGALIMVIAGLLAIVAAANGMYKSGINLIYIGAGAFILRSLVSLFFGSFDCSGFGAGGDFFNLSVGGRDVGFTLGVGPGGVRTAVGANIGDVRLAAGTHIPLTGSGPSGASPQSPVTHTHTAITPTPSDSTSTGSPPPDLLPSS